MGERSENMSRDLFLVNDIDLYNTVADLLENKNKTDSYIFGTFRSGKKSVVLIHIESEMFQINKSNIDQKWDLNHLPHRMLGDVDIELNPKYDSFINKVKTITGTTNSVYFFQNNDDHTYKMHLFLKQMNLDLNSRDYFNVFVHSYYLNDLEESIDKAKETSLSDRYYVRTKYKDLTSYYFNINTTRGITKQVEENVRFKNYATNKSLIFNTNYHSMLLLSYLYDYYKVNNSTNELTVSLLYDNSGSSKNKWFASAVKTTEKLKTPEIGRLEFRSQDISFTERSSNIFQEEMIDIGFEHNKVIEAVCTSVNTSDVIYKKPSLFNYDSINKFACKKLNITSNQLSFALDKLYKKELITNPETNSTTVSTSKFRSLKMKKAQYNSFFRYDQEYFNNQDFTEYIDANSDDAIVPTAFIPSSSVIDRLDNLQRNLYKMILKRTLCMFTSNSGLTVTEYTMEYKGKSFIYRSYSSDNKGFLDYLDTGETLIFDQLLPVNEGDVMPFVLRYVKKPHSKLLQEADLIPFFFNQYFNECENAGIDSTLAKSDLHQYIVLKNIVEFLYENDYLYNLDQRFVKLTPKGVILVGILKQLSIFKIEEAYKYTRWFGALEEGEAYFDTLIDSMNEDFEVFTKELKSADLSYLSLLTNRYNQFFQRYESEREERPDANIDVDDDDLGTCPFCSSGIMEAHYKRYMCNNCGGYANKVISSKQLSKETLQLIMDRGYSNRLSGFINRTTGSTFEGVCVRDDIKKRIVIRI